MNETPKKASAGIFSGLFSVIALILILLGVGFFLFGQIVPPGYIGVRQIKFGPGEGFATRGGSSGLFFTLPFYTDIHLIPSTLQILDMNRELGTGLKNLTTSDGAAVDIDVTVLYSFYAEASSNQPNPHGGPGDLIKNLSLSPQNWVKQIRSMAEKALLSNLPKLSTSGFYDPEARFALTKKALMDLRASLDPVGIKVDDLLVRRYTYQSQRIDDAIFQKNLQDQEAHLNQARSEFAAAEAQLEQYAAEGDAKVRTLRIQGENQAQVLRSEASLLENQLFAQADLEVAHARAEIDRLRASALASSAGADVYVARKITPVLRSLKGGVISNIDPYNLDQWAAKLGLQGGNAIVRDSKIVSEGER